MNPGTRLGPYEILAPLGAGGMGEVYRARDPRLGREVAIKVLPEAVATDPERLRRFEQEARAASALNHPAILTIFDIGSHESGPYVVSELLEGETLRERLAAGPLPPREALTFATELAQGLAAAHEKGIVHRDIKPENLFVTRDGRLKILDFGLARANTPGPSTTQAPTLAGTEPGVVLGTVAYMSPEQARGQPLDSRSDIFSAGAVLYEMLSGRKPFTGGSAAETMSAILREDPPTLAAVPPGVDRVVRRCLEKDPGRRFQTARDFAFALESVAGPTPSDTFSERPRSVAVLLFKDLAGDPANAHLGLGIADATITELAALKALLVRPTASVLRYRERPVDPEAAGRELGVDAVVDGNFQRSGSRLRVTVQLVRTADGRSLWGTKIDTSLDDLFRMQDEVSRKIAEALDVELSPSEAQRLARAGPSSGHAYELYLKGQLHLSGDTMLPAVNAAIECFEKALEIDPAFTLAQLGLADAYARMAFTFDPEGDWYERAEAMCQKALVSDPELPEGRYLRGRLLWHPRGSFDHARAMREFGAAIAGRPGFADAYHWLAQVLLHVGLLEESVAAFDRALDIDPQAGYARTHRPLAVYYQCKFGEALAATQVLTARQATPWNSYQEALCELHLGLRSGAIATLQKASRQFPGYVLVFALRGLIAAMEGDTIRAREQIDLIVRNKKLFGHFHHAEYDAACIEALLGNAAGALDWLEAAAGNGFPCVPFFENDPWLESLRREPRYRDLIERLRADREGYRRLRLEVTSSAA